MPITDAVALRPLNRNGLVDSVTVPITLRHIVDKPHVPVATPANFTLPGRYVVNNGEYLPHIGKSTLAK